MCRIGKHLAAVLAVLFLAGCTGDAMAPDAPPDPPNRPPVVTGAMPDQRLAGPGATTALDVAAHFSDPDGDALTYGAATSDTSVVSASATGSAVTLTGGDAGGTARVTVMARDPDGAEALATFGVTVNRLPVASEQIPTQALVAETPPLELDVSGYFGDPDGDALAFDAASSDTSVVTVTVAGAVTVLSAQAIGEAEVTVTVRDPDGLEASGAFSVIVTQNPDRAALAVLYEVTGGPNWRQMDNWLTDAPLDAWHGVEVSNGRVVELQLSFNRLTGSLPPELGNLLSLKWLNLGYNGLAGPIPPELGNLTELELLGLCCNDVTGPIPPELGDLAKLRGLFLESNALSGQIPPELGNLKGLEELRLDRNNLTGAVPTELFDLTTLKRLWLSIDSGPIPPEVGKLINLEWLELSGDGWTGSIPPELGYLTSLERLTLAGASLTGSIPPELGSLTNLKSLNLGSNRLAGPIPTELASLGSLEQLWLGFNALTGPIPPALGNLANLTILDLAANRLSGAIPPALGSLVRLRWLYLDGNELTGPIPLEFTNLADLEILRVHGGNRVCVPHDPSLRAWLLERGWSLFPCRTDPNARLLPRALMREDGNGLSLRLPNDLHNPLAVTVSNPAVVAAAVADGWLKLTPAGRGSAEVRVIPSGGGFPAIAGAVVRPAIGTFGIDIALDQPAPIGYEEAMTEAADWWSAVLNGTEWPDKPSCRAGTAKALADELLIEAGSAYSNRFAAAWVYPCFTNSGSAFLPGGGRIEVNTAGTPAAGDVDLVRHEIGHVLGLVLWPTSLGLVTEDGAYFTGAQAVSEYRAAGGDPSLPGVPIEPGSHWHKERVYCELMSGTSGCRGVPLAIDVMDAISLAALADAGYTVDMSKATPWRKPESAQADAAGGAAERIIDHVLIEWARGNGTVRK